MAYNATLNPFELSSWTWGDDVHANVAGTVATAYGSDPYYSFLNAVHTYPEPFPVSQVMDQSTTGGGCTCPDGKPFDYHGYPPPPAWMPCSIAKALGYGQGYSDKDKKYYSSCCDRGGVVDDGTLPRGDGTMPLPPGSANPNPLSFDSFFNAPGESWVKNILLAVLGIVIIYAAISAMVKG